MLARKFTFSLTQLLLGVGLAGILSGAVVAWLRSHTAPPLASWSVAFSPDGKTLAAEVNYYYESLSKNWWQVKLWDVRRGRTRLTLPGGGLSSGRVAFAPDGRTVATPCDDGSVRRWDVATGKERPALRSTGPQGFDEGRMISLAFAPGGKTLVAGKADGTTWWWDLDSEELRYSRQRTVGLYPEAFSPDGDTLVMWGDDGNVHLWDVARDEVRETLSWPKEVSRVALAPDGRALATSSETGSEDCYVTLWEVATAKQSVILRGPGKWVGGLAFSPDGTTLAVGIVDGTVELWDIADRQVRATLKGHASAVVSLAFAPDGKSLASGSSDGTVRLCDVQTARSRVILSVGRSSVPWLLYGGALLAWTAAWLAIRRKRRWRTDPLARARG